MSVWTHVAVTFAIDNDQNKDPEHINEVITKTSPKGSEGGIWGFYHKGDTLRSGSHGQLVKETHYGEWDDYTIDDNRQLLFSYYGDLRDFDEEEVALLNEWFDDIVEWLEKFSFVCLATLTYKIEYHKPTQRMVGFYAMDDEDCIEDDKCEN
ncbi:MAG: hypothetical protein Q4E47_01200 [Candidatus Saccharibacteria bacterium]|nr:hypothetical protein [Candidatus Saccharibacteria bacterium]